MADPERSAPEQTDLVFDGERFIPGSGVGIAYEHWSRYALAAHLVAGKDVLDIGCGEGYGSSFLAAAARSVLGFDASAGAVAHARRVHAGPNVRYEEATVRAFFERAPAAAFDVVVSFELIEHLTIDEQAVLLDGIRRVLRPGGVALISTPDKLLYTDVRLAKNPFHVREYYRDEFLSELRERFPQVRAYDQALLTGCAIFTAEESRLTAAELAWTDLVRALGTPRPGLRARGEYVVALVGEGPLPALPSFLLADFARKLIAEGLQHERRTADRLARELEEARRAWEGAMQDAERRARDAEAEAARMRRAARAARLDASRGALGRLRDLARLARSMPKGAWLRLPSTVRALRALRRAWLRLEASGLFDREHYLTQYRDVAASGVDPLDHFLCHGALEGRNPNPFFDTAYYLAQNPEVARSGMNPLLHYHLHGWRERRNPHPLFDTESYLDRNPDIARAGIDPLAHFLEHGAAASRRPASAQGSRAQPVTGTTESGPPRGPSEEALARG